MRAPDRRLSRRLGPKAAFAVVLLGMEAGTSRATPAEPRWVDDPQVLAPMRLRLDVGFSQTWAESPLAGSAQMFYVEGQGMSFQEAVGIGRGFEFGARFGVRLNRDGQGLRADEVARGFDTETFGTGLSTVANPELRLRWRALHVGWCELGLEDRLVLPIKPDPSVTEVLGGWLSIHLYHLVRLDAALNGVLGRESLAGADSWQPGLGLPIRVWINLTHGLFAGAFTTTHYAAKTKYTDSDTQLWLGVGAGYRLGDWDATALIESLDMLGGPTRRVGVGFGLSWHP